MQKGETSSLNCRDFIIHIVHELRQQSSSISASTQLLLHEDFQDLDEETKNFLLLNIKEQAHGIEQLQKEIQDWLIVNK